MGLKSHFCRLVDSSCKKISDQLKKGNWKSLRQGWRGKVRILSRKRIFRSNDEMGIYDIKFSVKIINIYSHAGGQK
jgi:hypothetical protein